MQMVWDELTSSFADTMSIVRVSVRLFIAMILGGLVGFERQAEHKTAGMRTHMLVSMGSALFVLTAIEMKVADATRVFQGIAAGVGFLGAGTIYRSADQREVKGLTTAAGIWVTAAVGMAVGAGAIWPSVMAVVLVLFVLWTLHECERFVRKCIKRWKAPEPHSPSPGPQPGTPEH